MTIVPLTTNLHCTACEYQHQWDMTRHEMCISRTAWSYIQPTVQRTKARGPLPPPSSAIATQWKLAKMYAIPLAECMQFHWQNVWNSTGKIYAIPLAECMQFHWQHVCDSIWMMPLDLKCFTQVNSNGQVLLQANRKLRMTLQQCNPLWCSASPTLQLAPTTVIWIPWVPARWWSQTLIPC
jgi:hypothetical protein